MSDSLPRTIADRLSRSALGRCLRRFARRQDGAAAVEFAFIAVPFLALLFAILETALVFFAGQSLESAVADTGRLIMTGQAQQGISPSDSTKVGYTANDIKQVACDHSYGLFDCNNLYVSVQTYGSFGTTSTAPPLDANQQLNTANLPFNMGVQGSIVVVQLYYQWPIYVSLLDANLSNQNGQKRLLIATSVFVNEPY